MNSNRLYSRFNRTATTRPVSVHISTLKSLTQSPRKQLSPWYSPDYSNQYSSLSSTGANNNTNTTSLTSLSSSPPTLTLAATHLLETQSAHLYHQSFLPSTLRSAIHQSLHFHTSASIRMSNDKKEDSGGKQEKNLGVSIGFLGAGAMASALANGMIEAGAVDKNSVWLSDAAKDQLKKYEKLGVNTTSNNSEVAKNCDVLIMAVKPHILPVVLIELKDHITEKHLLISIAAGVPIETIEEILPDHARVCRVMPNTPSLVGAGAAGIALGSNATDEDGELVEKLFNCVGKAVRVTENLLDPVTGVSGSGPAYIFILIEALADGGVRAGLPRDTALTLAAQVVYGSAKMVIETGLHPGQLKDQVTSPGGTTITAVHALETGNFRNTIINAVKAASDKGKELADLAAQQAKRRTQEILKQMEQKKK